MRSGLGLRFVRDLEQGKSTVRMDKVNVALGMFGMEAAPLRKENKEFKHSENFAIKNVNIHRIDAVRNDFNYKVEQCAKSELVKPSK